MNNKLKIQIGAQFGKWTVLSFHNKKEAIELGYKGGAAYLCECSCNKKTKRYKSSTSLLKSRSTSCGCDRWNNAKTRSLMKHGVESAAQRPDIISKRKNTNIEKYGVENPYASSHIMKPHYGKSQTNEAKAKRKTTNLTKYGVENLLQKDSPVRVNFKQTKESINKTLTTKRDTGLGMNVLPNGKSVTEFCRENGVNSQHANYIYRGMGAQACQEYISNKNTDTASFLERYLQKLIQPEVDVEFFNKEVLIGGKIHRPDFILNDQIHLNVDGIVWHSDRYKKDNMYHFNKRACYENDNKQLLQFRSDEVFAKPNIVKSIILHKMGMSIKRFYARKLSLYRLDFKDVKSFLQENHLMSSGAPGKAIALKSNNDVVAVFTYKINKDNSMEVLRYATHLNTSVVGGFDKLLKYAISLNETVTSVVSFVDLRYGNGRSLEKLGFSRDAINLGWAWVDKFSKTQNRLRVRASDDKTELTKASELGWAKIYDAGQAKYTLKIS